jgi:hypothetical protein
VGDEIGGRPAEVDIPVAHPAVADAVLRGLVQSVPTPGCEPRRMRDL